MKECKSTIIRKIQEILDGYIEELNKTNGKDVTDSSIGYSAKIMMRSSLDIDIYKESGLSCLDIFSDRTISRLVMELFKMYILGYRKEYDYVAQTYINMVTTKYPMIASYNPWASVEDAEVQLSTLEACLGYFKNYPLGYNIDKITPYVETNNNISYQTTEVVLALRMVARHHVNSQEKSKKEINE